VEKEREFFFSFLFYVWVLSFLVFLLCALGEKFEGEGDGKKVKV